MSVQAARILFLRGHLDKAEEALSGWDGPDEDDEDDEKYEYHLWYYQILLCLGKEEEAIKHLEACIKVDSSKLNGLIFAYSYYEFKHELEKSKQYLDLAEKHAPDELATYAMKADYLKETCKFLEASEYYKKLYEKSDEKDLKYIRLYLECLTKSDFKNKGKVFDIINEEFKDKLEHEDIYGLKANVHFLAFEYRNAVEEIKKAIDKNPCVFQYRLEYIIFLYYNKQYDVLKEEYEKILDDFEQVIFSLRIDSRVNKQPKENEEKDKDKQDHASRVREIITRHKETNPTQNVNVEEEQPEQMSMRHYYLIQSLKAIDSRGWYLYILSLKQLNKRKDYEDNLNLYNEIITLKSEEYYYEQARELLLNKNETNDKNEKNYSDVKASLEQCLLINNINVYAIRELISIEELEGLEESSTDRKTKYKDLLDRHTEMMNEDIDSVELDKEAKEVFGESIIDT